MTASSFRILQLSVLLLVLTGLFSSLIYYLKLYPEKDAPRRQLRYWKIQSPEACFVERMTPEEKAGQLMIVGFTPGALKSVPDRLRTYKYGGIILYKRNITDVKGLYALTSDLKRWNRNNRLPLFIGMDEEGGTVSRLPDSATKFPEARLIGRINNQDLTYQIGKVMGAEMRAMGINMNFAPVLDIQTNPQNSFLSSRVFGFDSERVTRHGVFMIRGMRSEKVIAVPKHFPGHGDSDADSHGRLPRIFIDSKKLLTREAVPYRYAIGDGLDALMVGHIAFPNIDTTGAPATLSRVMLDDILRTQLKFDGLAISDEIEMRAYMEFNDTLESSIIRSFNNGIDMFIVGHTSKIQDEVYKILYQAILSGKISAERINRTIERILKIKLKYKLYHYPDYAYNEMAQTVGGERHRQILKSIDNYP